MKSVWSRRLPLFFLVLLLALVPFSSALATPPEFSFADGYGSETFDCPGFPLQVELWWTVKISNHFDQNGDFKVYIERVQEQISTYTNLVTGASISSTRGAGNGKILMERDGTTTYTVNGMINILTIPGQGVLVHDTGRIVFDASTFEVLFSAGQFTVHGPEGNSLEPLCDALE